MKLTFWGAARQVTGSMFLLEFEDDYKVLIDCGLNLERKKEQSKKNSFPFDASDIDVVLLTHAHIDHSGNLPNLFREGFEGNIYATLPTADLSTLLLMDSAQLNRRRLNAYHKKRGKRRKNIGNLNTAEMYLEKDVKTTEASFAKVVFNQRFALKKGLYATFIPAGHLLGAANICIESDEDGTRKRILFSGDIGRFDYPLLVNPNPVPQVDYVVCETTYGSRLHTAKGKPEDELAKVVHEACVVKKGRLIIPAFSVGRTQALLYTLHKLSKEGKLPSVKIFSDSPLGFQSTRTYLKYHQYLNEEAQEFLKENGELFDFENLTYVEDLKTSKEISNYVEPCIIISASGMLEGGRIQHHIKANLPNPYCTILMVGYAAQGTIGYKLMTAKSIVIEDKEVPILATILKTDIYSGHGDLNDLTNFVKQQNVATLKTLFLVHGEPEAMEFFKDHLSKEGYQQTEIPEYGKTFVL